MAFRRSALHNHDGNKIFLSAFSTSHDTLLCNNSQAHIHRQTKRSVQYILPQL